MSEQRGSIFENESLGTFEGGMEIDFERKYEVESSLTVNRHCSFGSTVRQSDCPAPIYRHNLSGTARQIVDLQ